MAKGSSCLFGAVLLHLLVSKVFEHFVLLCRKHVKCRDQELSDRVMSLMWVLVASGVVPGGAVLDDEVEEASGQVMVEELWLRVWYNGVVDE